MNKKKDTFYLQVGEEEGTVRHSYKKKYKNNFGVVWYLDVTLWVFMYIWAESGDK